MLKWPLVEALLTYEHLLKQEARHDWELAMLQWAILAQAGATKRRSPPDPPDILKE